MNGESVLSYLLNSPNNNKLNRTLAFSINSSCLNILLLNNKSAFKLLFSVKSWACNGGYHSFSVVESIIGINFVLVKL